MHCNLRSPDVMSVIFRFNYDATPSLKSLTLSIPILLCFAADTCTVIDL